MRLQSNYKQLSHQKRKTKNIDGAVRFPNKHRFQLHTSTIFECWAPRGDIGKRRWLAYNKFWWTRLSIVSLKIFAYFFSPNTQSLRNSTFRKKMLDPSSFSPEVEEISLFFLNMFKHVKRIPATLRINFWINCTLLGADNFLPQCRAQTCKHTDPLTQQTRKYNSQQL